jgi:hypothetical protein
MACKNQGEGGKPAHEDSNPTGALASTHATNAPRTAADLFADHVAAAGGAQRLAAIHSMYFEGTIEEAKSKVNGTMRTWWSNEKFYVVQSLAGIGEVRAGSDGTSIWLDDPIHELRLLDGVEAEQYRWSSAPIGSEAGLKQFASFGPVTKTTFEGEDAFEVVGTSVLGDKVTFYFSVTTMLLIGQKYGQVSPTGTVPVTSIFSEYREVDGLKIPHKMIARMALADISQTLNKVEFNSALDDARFAMPVELQRVPARPDRQPPAPIRSSSKKDSK